MLTKKLLTISVLLLLIYTKANSQTTVEYLYDEAGNRIERKVLILQTKSNPVRARLLWTRAFIVA